jgi:leucyl aminopeptidase
MRLMNELFRFGHAGTPILMMALDQYDQWLGNVDSTTRNWIASNRFEAPGTLLLPAADGTLKTVLHVVKELHHFFVAGDLPLQLPTADYRLDLYPAPEHNHRQISLNFIQSWGLSLYRFEHYQQSKTGDGKKAPPVLVCSDQSLLDQALHTVNAIGFVRDLINAPANDMMPEHLSHEVDQLAALFDAETRHLVGDELLSNNYPAIHIVGRASVHPPRLIELAWGSEGDPKLTLVGKGVCFDSGGLDLKPAQYMRQMKKDMGGAAHVLGLAWLIMAHRLPVRLRVLIPAVENAVSGNAFRPGDVIGTRAGLSVEIDNTDAEGRLVLCDALHDADREQPDLIIDYATLTGAARIALGTELPALFANDDTLARSVIAAGLSVNDPVWQLPLFSQYEDTLKSDIADTLNSSPNPYGGAITAALYLQKFLPRRSTWLHFDVMAWNLRKLPGRPVGGDAMGLRAMFACLQERYPA